MPLQLTKSDGTFATYRAHKNDVFNVSHSVKRYERTHSTTVSTIAAQNVDDGLSIGNETTTDDLWSAQITCSSTGTHRYELKETYADGSKQILEFEVVVEDI